MPDYGETVRLTNAQYYNSQGRTVGGAWGFSDLGITDWPTDYWAIDIDTDGDLILRPAVVLEDYTIFGTVDTRGESRVFALTSAVHLAGFQTPQGPTGVEGVEPYVEVVAALDVDEAIATAREHAEAPR